MSTGTPVVVSRIQNRRGTQAQFDNLYPKEYTSAPGATSSAAVITVNTTDNLVVGAKPQVINGIGQFVPGTTILSVDSITQFTVSAEPLVALSGGAIVYVKKYNGQGGATGPNILQPGELALCTDTRRVFMGNMNGEYVELASIGAGPTDIVTTPLVLSLLPATWTEISALTYLPTPFMDMLYSVVDIPTDNPNDVGLNFAKNGELRITATGITATLVDTCTSINVAPLVPNPNPLLPDIPPDINFKAGYDVGGNIVISYMHNFPIPLTLSVSSIIWSAL